jgi:CHAT domain-containing protein
MCQGIGRSCSTKSWRSIVLVMALLFCRIGAAQADDLAALGQRVDGHLAGLRYGDALAAADELLTRATALHGAGTLEYAAALSRKATVLHVQGRVGEADPLFNEVLRIYRTALPHDHVDMAAALNNIGMQHVWLGRFREAPKPLLQALEIIEKLRGPNDIAAADILGNLTYAYNYLNRTEEAQAFAERAKSILDKSDSPDDLRTARVLQNLASAQEYQGQFKEAEANLRTSAVLFSKALPDDDPRIGAVLTRLALNLYLQGRFKEAEGYYRDAVRRQDRGPVTLTTPATLTDFALNQMAQGRLDEAEALLQKGLEQRRQLLPPRNPEIARTLSNLAEVKHRKGEHAAALDLNREAVAIVAWLGKRNQISLLQFDRLIKAAWALYDGQGQRGGSTALLEEAFAAAQRAAETGTAKTVARMAARFAAEDPKLRNLLKDLHDLDDDEAELQRRLSHAIALEADSRTALSEDIRRMLAANDTRRAEMNAQVSAAFPAYAELANPEPVPAKAVAATIAEDEAMVFLLPSFEATWVWAISRDKTVWTRAPLTSKDVASFVRVLREQVTLTDKLKAGAKPALFDLGFAHDLYVKLFGGLAPVLAGKSHLLIVPTGALDQLPFPLLVTKKPKTRRPPPERFSEYGAAGWLVRDYAVSTLPSVASLENLRRAGPAGRATKPLIGFANPILGSESGAASASRGGDPAGAVARVSRRQGVENVDRTALLRLKALPESEKEVQTVAGHLGAPAEEIRSRAEATETAVRQSQLADYRTVYFATHGLMAGEIPGLEEPALVLSLPESPTAGDDGLLTASEIAGLTLDADLVVLSACNTAAPQSGGQEGLSGLARAFFQAGARAMLVSHWAVPSEAAVKLTTRMFEIQRKEPKLRRAEALRRSIVALLADGSDPLNVYPMVWAPFVLVGDGR